MRYIAKANININKAVRLMINESQYGIYVFGFDTMIDSYSNWDCFYDNIDEAIEFGLDEFGIFENDWIRIDSEEQGCQQDWVVNVISRHNKVGTQFILKSTGLVIDTSHRTDNINAMTVNERLFAVGLIDEFDKSIKIDELKCRRILEYIDVNEESIKK